MNTKTPLPPAIEPLEPRIAPASIAFTDVDGDMVTVSVSGAATMLDLDHAVHRSASGAGFTITGIVLAGHSVFKNADLTVTADVAGGGDGFVNVGDINAKKLDLHDVSIDGNLVQIDAGDKATTTPALNRLSAASLGVPPGVSGDAPASFINGSLTTLNIDGDVNKAWLRIAKGGAASITVRGALIGGKSAHSGSVTATGEITLAQIGAFIGADGFESGALGTFGKIGTALTSDITGGAGKHSGAILTKGGIDTVTVRGALTGGEGFESGSVGSLGPVGSVDVTGDVVGGRGAHSGQIVSKNSLRRIYIDGDLRGGAGAESGTVGSDGDIRFVGLGGSLVGGSRAFTGAILSGGNVAEIEIDGSIRTDPGVQAKFTAIISARGSIDRLSVGEITGTPTNRVIIAAAGDLAISATGKPPALGSVSVENSSMAYTNILGGYGILPGRTFKNPDAAIGSVFIEGDCIASTIAAGKLVADRVFGGATELDTDRSLVLDGGQRHTVSTIYNVEIAGYIVADQKAGVISAFIAEQIGSISAGFPTPPALQSGAHNDREVIIDGGEGVLVAVINEGNLRLN